MHHENQGSDDLVLQRDVLAHLVAAAARGFALLAPPLDAEVARHARLGKKKKKTTVCFTCMSEAWLDLHVRTFRRKHMGALEMGHSYVRRRTG